jgi:hypothetical protein
MTYSIISRPTFSWAQLKSKNFKITICPRKKHLEVFITGKKSSGKKFQKRGLSSIKSNLTSFELKVCCLFFFKLARDEEKVIISDINYAQIFGSIFD